MLTRRIKLAFPKKKDETIKGTGGSLYHRKWRILLGQFDFSISNDSFPWSLCAEMHSKYKGGMDNRNFGHKWKQWKSYLHHFIMIVHLLSRSSSFHFQNVQKRYVAFWKEWGDSSHLVCDLSWGAKMPRRHYNFLTFSACVLCWCAAQAIMQSWYQPVCVCFHLACIHEYS